MIIRKIDADNDWTFGQGLSNYAINEEAIDENIKTRLLSWIGDCFFALQDGIDWKQRLDVGQKDALEDEIRSLILQSYGVMGINSIDVVFNSLTRVIGITYNIQTIYSSSFETTLQQSAGV